LDLEARALAAGQPSLAYLPITLNRSKLTPMTLWWRNVFPNKFLDMASATKSPDLRAYLRVVMGASRLRSA
jgi:hypothetical protein